MTFNYENYLVEKLIEIQNSEGLSNFNFVVEEEQIFVKRKDYEENTIYIVIKYLADNKQIGATTQPIQMLILSEQNQLDISRVLFSKFATDNNWVSFTSGTDFIKQQYSEPVVLSNFNPVMYGYRTVMYMMANLTIIEDVIDVKDLKIRGLGRYYPIEATAFNLSYSMQPNTQQIKTEKIASSVKSVSSLSLSMTIPFTTNHLTTRIINILSENLSGDDIFYISFELNGTVIGKNYKLISAQLVTAINQVPALQLGFIK